MAEGEPSLLHPPSPPAVSSPPSVSSPPLRLWPPTQRTRDAVLRRLVEMLSSPSALSARYGLLPSPESASLARLLEAEAFSAAAAADVDDGEGTELLQLYSREISLRALHAAKARAAPPCPLDGEAAPPSPSRSSPSPRASAPIA